jgi:hypothetical protein
MLQRRALLCLCLFVPSGSVGIKQGRFHSFGDKTQQKPARTASFQRNVLNQYIRVGVTWTYAFFIYPFIFFHLLNRVCFKITSFLIKAFKYKLAISVFLYADSGDKAVYGVVPRTLHCCDCRFESRWGHRNSYFVFVVCCVGSGLGDGLIPCSEEFYLVCVSNCECV